MSQHATASLSPAVQALAAKPSLLIMATKRSDGSIQLNPIWFEFRDGLIVVNSNTRRSWPRNLQRDREATMLIVDPEVSDRYAQIRGQLVDVTPDPAVEVIDRLARRYTGEKFRALEPGEERITMRLKPTKVSGDLI
ncbi:MAG TPA: PPOX class F420-dependent oxidoreductase [Candidatus Dormibacteraeota bacterium]